MSSAGLADIAWTGGVGNSITEEIPQPLNIKGYCNKSSEYPKSQSALLSLHPKGQVFD